MPKSIQRRPGSRTIFLSYSDCDHDLAEDFDGWIEKTFGVQCFFAPRSLRAGGAWYDELINALRSCRLGIVLLTPNCAESVWVQFETGGILGQGKSLIPLCFHPFKEIDIKPPLNFRQACSWSLSGRKRLAERIVQELELESYNEEYVIRPGLEYDSTKIRKEWQQSAEAFLKHVADNLHRREEEQIGERFRDYSDPLSLLVRWLIDHHWISYKTVIEAGVLRGAIPLPDEPRMAAAMAAVEAATKSVHAISIQGNDRWNIDGGYLQANIEAAARIHRLASRGEYSTNSCFGVSRVIVISSESECNEPELKDIIAEQKANGIRIKCVSRSKLEKIRMTYPEIRIRNLLIVDEKVVTRSLEGSSDGELVVSKHEIDSEKRRFNVIWQAIRANADAPMA